MSWSLHKSLLCTICSASIIWACARNDDDGFGGGGAPIDPVTDTGPWYGTDDTGSDTASPDTSGPDTADTDTADTDTGDTGDTAPVIIGTGYSKGDTAFNLEAKDQDEDDWSLHAQYGNIVVLVLGEAWDSRFVSISAYLKSLEKKYGIVAAPVLLTDSTETPADEEDAEAWADLYDLDPVLWDPSVERAIQLEWAPLVRPRLFLIDEEMKIQWVNEGATNEVQLKEKIEDLVFD